MFTSGAYISQLILTVKLLRRRYVVSGKLGKLKKFHSCAYKYINYLSLN
jgi:hypothetical protein